MKSRAVARPLEPPSDPELVARILSGDTHALEVLMRRHNRTLYRTARAILRDDAEAEEAVQDAYLQAYRKLDTFRGASKVSTWLVRIAANEALMRRRRNPRPADSPAPEPVSDAPGPQADAERMQMRRLLESSIDALPDGYRAVFVLRELEELSVDETAAVLGIPLATVRTRHFRARSLLRTWLAGDIDTKQGDAFAFAGTRCDRIVRGVLSLLVAGFAAASLAACTEAPPRTAPEAGQAHNDSPGETSLRERTLKQGESGRFSY